MNPAIAAISAGQFHTCALTSSGGVKCWGSNFQGQLGNGTTTERAVPGAIDVSGLASGISAISAGFGHTCALTIGGGVKCWGYNLYGQLGNGSTTDSSVPVDVSGLGPGIGAITAGPVYTCALTTNGGVKCWGNNGSGQLGNGPNPDSSVPVDIADLAGSVRAIAAGQDYTCALTTDDAVKCWGYYTGSVPVEVAGATRAVTAIAAGESHVCALMKGGRVRCWGSNADGKLGNGTTTEMLAATAGDVSGLASGVSAIAAGGRHTCALTNGGGVKCWGWNGYGQLGDGTTATSGSPVDVSGLASGAIAIAAGSAHTCALMSDGGVKCWGENDSGQLGNASTTSSSVPVDMDVAPPWAVCEPPSPASAVLPVCGSAREILDRGILMAPGPGGSLYAAISAPTGPVTLALLDHSGIPQAGWPVVLADTISCQFLLPVADGSVRVVCTLENPGNLYNPMGALAFDSKGAMLAGWPADLGCCITDGRLVGDELVLLQSSPTSDVPVPAGQPVAIEQVLTVATDGSIRGGTGVPVFAGEPDGVADDIALASGFDDGIESGPALRPDGRIVITVGSYEQGATRVVVFDADRKAVLARSAELPMASVEKPSDLDVCVVRTPSPPIVAADGTVFVFSELDPRVFALDPSLEVKGGWPYRPATPLVRDSFDASCDPRGIPAVGPDSTLYLPLEASDATAGGSLVAVGPDGRVRPGWPVELSRPGAEFWSVVVGSDGTVYALAVEPRPSNGFSASILAIAPDSTVLWTTTIIDA